MLKQVAICALSLVSTFGVAQARCNANGEVQTYLESNPSWKLVNVSDLVGDDRALWQQYHRGLCPGVASLNFGNGHTSVVLALLSRSRSKRLEKLVVLSQTCSDCSEKVISPAYEADQISVVWRTERGRFHDVMSGRNVFVKNDSAVYEVMESGALLFYWSNGKYRSLQTAD